ncbi:MAG: IclR family transcriptional regulator [Arthrobacter sp.]|nr:IclR family transcriptional regulator [Arthrobacter sp.]
MPAMTQGTQETTARSGGVQSVERAFALLETIAAAGGELTLSELSQRTPLPLPTIHRLLRTLVTMGHVRQLPDRSYALGPRLIHLGEVANRQLGALAKPIMRSLVDQLGETANLAVLDDDRVTYVGQVPSPHAMRMFTEVGQRVPLHYSGVGKAILAQLPEEQVRGLMERTGMASRTANTHTDVESLLADLAATRERGYAVDEQEQEMGSRCYAVAIPDSATRLAVSVSGPISRVDESFADRAVPALTAAASAISQALRSGV